MAKVLVGIVTTGKMHYCLDHLVGCLKKQSVPTDIIFVVNGDGAKAYATLLRSNNLTNCTVVVDESSSDNSSDKVLSGRKIIRKKFLEGGYDNLMMVDSDVMLPARAIEVLLATKFDVVSGAYLNAQKVGDKTVVVPLLYKDLGDGACKLYKYESVYVPALLEIGAAGLGCTLASRKVVEKVDFRLMPNGRGDDIAFYVDSRKSGFKTMAHTGVKCLYMPYPLSDPRAKMFEWSKKVSSTTAQLNLN